MTPTTTIAEDRQRNTWVVALYWKDTKHRRRLSLGVPLDADPTTAFEEFKRHVLPGVIEEYNLNPPPPKESKREKARDSANPKGPRIRDLIDWFIGTHLPQQGNKPKTITKYDQQLRDFELFCRSSHIGRVGQISWSTIEKWQQWQADHRGSGKPRAQNTRRHEIATVRGMLNAAIDAGRLEGSPVKKWLLPKKVKRSRFQALRREEVPEFLKLIQTHEPIIYRPTLWTVQTGWRASDVLDLRWGEVDLKRRLIDRDQIKTADDLDFPLTDQLAAILEEEHAASPAKPKRQDFVFPLPIKTEDPNQIPVKRYEYFYKHMRRCCTRFDFRPVTPHDLRKTFGTLLANGDPHADPPIAPCPPRILQNLMGHARLETTLTYYIEADETGMSAWLKTYANRLNC